MAAMETWSAPAILAWSITRTIRPESAARSAITTTGVFTPLVASSPSTLARTARMSTVRLLTCTWPEASMRIAITSVIFFSSCGSFEGRFNSRPTSFTKEVVTMKKISMMKTMSNIGVMLISASSSLLAILRLMPWQPSVSYQQPFEPVGLDGGLLLQQRGEVKPGQGGHQAGHRRDGRLGNAARHQSRVAGAGKGHHVEHRDHAGHGAEQAEQGQHGHQRLHQQEIALALKLDLGHQQRANLVGRPRSGVAALLPGRLGVVDPPGQHKVEEPDALDDECPHQDRDEKDGVENVSSHLEEVPDRHECIEERVHLPFSDCLAMIPALCSSRTSISALLRLATTLCSSTSGIATVRPSTVVTRACQMPPAISFGSPVPNSVIAWKVAIMPVTVPSSPSSGATAAMILIDPCQFSSFGTSLRMASSSLSSSVSVSTSRLSW